MSFSSIFNDVKSYIQSDDGQSIISTVNDILTDTGAVANPTVPAPVQNIATQIRDFFQPVADKAASKQLEQYIPYAIGAVVLIAGLIIYKKG